MRRMRSVLAGFVVVGSLGCYHPTTAPDFYRKPAEKSQTSFANFQKVVAKEKKTLLGYVETEQIVPAGGRDAVEQHFVYNARFQRLGFIADKGDTYRYVRDTDTEFLGNHPIDVGATFILGFAGEVTLERMK